MTLNVLFAAKSERWDQYEPQLRAALTEKGINAHLATEIDPSEVDYIVYAPNSPLQDFTPYTRTKAVLNLWAGVEKIVGNQTLTMPLARMVDPGLTQGMVEWVMAHTLRHHLAIDLDINRPAGEWQPRQQPLAQERRVLVMGLGALGTAVAQALQTVGFDVHGWSRSAKALDGVTCHHGADGLRDALAQAEIAILLLPDTPGTENTLNAETLALLPRGACIINPGRGPLIDDEALLSALDSGQIGHATLDVFRVEPLPADHPFWAHPRVTVTPHIAAETRASTASRVVAENIRRSEAGEPLLYLVNRNLGY